MSTKINIVIEQGASFHFEANLFDSANAPLSNVGITVAAQVRKSYSSNTAYPFDTELDVGLVKLDMNANTTAGIEAGRYVYDIVLTTTNTVIRAIEGLATITPGVTRNS